MCYYSAVYHLEKAEMTPELCDDLINFSFDDLWDLNKPKMHDSDWEYVNVHNFSSAFLGCLKRLVCRHIYLCTLHIFILLCSQLLKHIASPGLFMLTSTGSSVMSWESIVHSQDSPYFLEACFSLS